MSFSEIHFVEHEIMSLKKNRKPFFTFTKIILFSGSIILLLAVILTYFLIIRDTNKITTQNYTETLKKIDINKDNETEKYRLLAKIEFSENETTNSVNDNDNQSTKQSISPEKEASHDISNEKKSESKEIRETFEIKIYNIYQRDIDKIKSEFKGKSAAVTEKVSKKVFWNVYKEDKNGKYKIGDINVVKIKSFKDRETAVKSAQKLGIRVFIKKEIVEKKIFDMTISSFETAKEADSFVKNRYLKGKSLEIIKKY